MSPLEEILKNPPVDSPQRDAVLLVRHLIARGTLTIVDGKLRAAEDNQ